MLKAFKLLPLIVALSACTSPPTPRQEIASGPNRLEMARQSSNGVRLRQEHLGWKIYDVEGGVYGKMDGGREFRADSISIDESGITLHGYPVVSAGDLPIPVVTKGRSASSSYRIEES